MKLLKAPMLLLLINIFQRESYGSPLNVCTANITEDDSLVLLYKRITEPNTRICMHFMWSMPSRNNVTKYPTLFTAQTDDETGLCTRNCSTFVDESTHSINISEIVDGHFSFGLVFTRLIEFLVPADKAPSYESFNYSSTCECEKFPEHDMCYNHSIDYAGIYLNESYWEWDYYENNQSFVGVYIDPDSDEETARFGIRTNFPQSSEDMRLSYFPKTLFTENSTTSDIIIENFPYNLSNISNIESKKFSRLALELFVIHGPQTQNGSTNNVVTLDDEYTPSVFTTTTYSMSTEDPVFAQQNGSGFLQWKPISYQSDERQSTKSQHINALYTADCEYCNVGLNGLPGAFARSVFGDNASNVTRWFFVFGTSGDDTFFNNEYLTWTSLVGFGQIPQDQISQVVITIISVGLGVPAVLVLLGAVYIIIRKKPWQNLSRMIRASQQGYTKLK